ncbi:hypothetical protein T07_11478 [Trichinella nelsoni]|uniref:Uncharacterized protein n=1 Tax=Trichinella nelsoni TaxID=6336 RepID=A0A0V0RPS2_9BILA|nr:hypothetical protein T07_11478 [Trichinella nelsoni]
MAADVRMLFSHCPPRERALLDAYFGGKILNLKMKMLFACENAEFVKYDCPGHLGPDDEWQDSNLPRQLEPHRLLFTLLRAVALPGNGD